MFQYAKEQLRIEIIAYFKQINYSENSKKKSHLLHILKKGLHAKTILSFNISRFQANSI